MTRFQNVLRHGPQLRELSRLPPVIWLALALVAYLMQWFVPEPRLLPDPFYNIGPAIFVLGMGLILAAGYKFMRRRTNIHAFRDPEKLITDGVFAISRNPIYLGFTLMLLGLGVYWNAVYALTPAVVFFGVANFYYAPAEEAAAERIFGADFLAYCKRVRRWI